MKLSVLAQEILTVLLLRFPLTEQEIIEKALVEFEENTRALDEKAPG